MSETGASPSRSRSSSGEAALPRNFIQYIRSFGPGFVVVLTWLGAGDIVAAGVSGGNYGYALAWAIVLAMAVRYAFVSLIARYQLCNPRGEGVLDGLARFNRLYAPFLLIAVLIWGPFEFHLHVGGDW